MLNVVTIDFDIIMAPSIELYNNKVSPTGWEEIFVNNHQLMLSQADLTHYQRLTNWLLKAFEQIPKENVHFIQDHEHAINCIPKNENIVLTNIDHHHDVLYNKDDIMLNCGNWVRALSDMGILQRYAWINNGNSAPYLFEENKDIINYTIDLREFNFDTLAVPDVLILCFSPMWIPPAYRPLFFTWMDFFNHLHGMVCNFED